MSVALGVVVASARRALVGHLTAGRAEEACRVVGAAIDQGLGPVETYVDLVASAVEEALGTDPARDEVSLTVADGVVAYLNERFERPPHATKGFVLVGVPPGERHDAEARLTAEVLGMDGFEVHLLAAGASTSSWCAAVRDTEQLVAVVVAVAAPAGARLATSYLPDLRAAVDAHAPHAVLALVGPGLEGGREAARGAGAHTWSPDARGLALLLDARLGAPTRRALLASVSR